MNPLTLYSKTTTPREYLLFSRTIDRKPNIAGFQILCSTLASTNAPLPERTFSKHRLHRNISGLISYFVFGCHQEFLFSIHLNFTELAQLNPASTTIFSHCCHFSADCHSLCRTLKSSAILSILLLAETTHRVFKFLGVSTASAATRKTIRRTNPYLVGVQSREGFHSAYLLNFLISSQCYRFRRKYFNKTIFSVLTIIIVVLLVVIVLMAVYCKSKLKGFKCFSSLQFHSHQIDTLKKRAKRVIVSELQQIYCRVWIEQWTHVKIFINSLVEIGPKSIQSKHSPLNFFLRFTCRLKTFQLITDRIHPLHMIGLMKSKVKFCVKSAHFYNRM